MSKSGEVIANYGAHPGGDRDTEAALAMALKRRTHVACSVRVSRARRPITPTIIKQYRDRVLSVIPATDAYAVQEWTELSGDDAFPLELSAFDQLVTDTSHHLWIREATTDLDTTACG